MAHPELLGVAAAMCVVALLGAYRLGWLPLWLDEAWSEWYAHRAPGEAWRLTRDYDTHPPLYQTLLSVWIAVAGASEVALRGLSVALMVATVPVVHLIGRTAAPGNPARLAGVTAAWLFALSPLQVAYAQEARPYAALTFAVALMLYGACRLLRGERTTPFRSPGWWSFTIGSALALWLHNTAFLAVASVWAVVLAAAVARRRTDAALFRQLLIAGGVTALLYAPFLPYLLDQAGRVSQGFWIARPSLRALEDAVRYLSGSGFGYTGFAALVFCTVAAFGVRSLDEHGKRWFAVLLAAATLAPILLQFGISLIGRPVFLTRTLVYVLVPFFVLVAAGIVGMRSPVARCLVGALAAALLAGGLRDYYATHAKEPWHRIAGLVAAQASERDVVLVVPNYAAIPLRYYLPGRTLPRGVLLPLPGEFPAVTAAPNPTGIRGAPRVTRTGLEPARKTLADASRVLVVMRGESLYDPDGVVQDVLTELGFRETAKDSFFLGLITLRTFERTGAR
jgi:hypothetical protein